MDTATKLRDLTVLLTQRAIKDLDELEKQDRIRIIEKK
jgi:hypothetical protein